MNDTTTAHEPGGSKGPLVLVIDDDPDTLAICERVLRAGGYRTALAATAAEGLAWFDGLRPALVVLDLAMPGTDGFAVARAIRARPDGARLPILVCSGLESDAQAPARAAGGTAFCTKPLEPRRLLAMVRELCPAG